MTVIGSFHSLFELKTCSLNFKVFNILFFHFLVPCLWSRRGCERAMIFKLALGTKLCRTAAIFICREFFFEGLPFDFNILFSLGVPRELDSLRCWLGFAVYLFYCISYFTSHATCDVYDCQTCDLIVSCQRKSCVIYCYLCSFLSKQILLPCFK